MCLIYFPWAPKFTVRKTQNATCYTHPICFQLRQFDLCCLFKVHRLSIKRFPSVGLKGGCHPLESVNTQIKFYVMWHNCICIMLRQAEKTGWKCWGGAFPHCLKLNIEHNSELLIFSVKGAQIGIKPLTCTRLYYSFCCMQIVKKIFKPRIYWAIMTKYLYIF